MYKWEINVKKWLGGLFCPQILFKIHWNRIEPQSVGKNYEVRKNLSILKGWIPATIEATDTGPVSNCRKCNLQFTFKMYDVGIRKKIIRLWIESPKSEVHCTVVENVAFFSICTKLRSALKVSNLDFSLCQFHKKVNNKSELPGLTQGTPISKTTRVLD